MKFSIKILILSMIKAKFDQTFNLKIDTLGRTKKGKRKYLIEAVINLDYNDIFIVYVFSFSLCFFVS